MTAIDWVLGLMIGISVLTYADAFGFSRAQQTTEKIWIHKLSGFIWCEMGSGVQKETGQAELEAKQVKVYKAARKNINPYHIQVCHQPSDVENWYLIDGTTDPQMIKDLGYTVFDPKDPKDKDTTPPDTTAR